MGEGANTSITIFRGAVCWGTPRGNYDEQAAAMELPLVPCGGGQHGTQSKTKKICITARSRFFSTRRPNLNAFFQYTSSFPTR